MCYAKNSALLCFADASPINSQKFGPNNLIKTTQDQNELPPKFCDSNLVMYRKSMQIVERSDITLEIDFNQFADQIDWETHLNDNIIERLERNI